MASSKKIGRNDPCHCGKLRINGTPEKYKRCCEEKDKDRERRRAELKERVASFSRRDFISGPYKACPNCKNEEFGVFFGTGGRSYTRECRACWHSETIAFPPIRKRIIYLDQFLISNIAKVLDPTARSHSITANEPFWLEVYKKLDRLSSLNLIVCPDSFFHNEESMLSGDPSYKKLRQVYEHLSHGITFYDHNTIMRFQVHQHFENYLNNEPTKPLELNPEHVTHGNPHEWLGRMRIGVESRPFDGQIEAIRDERNRMYEAMKPIFGRWQEETGRDFMEWVREEANAFGKGTFLAYVKHLKKQVELPQKYADQILAGKELDISFDDILPPPSVEIMQQIIMVLRGRGFENQTLLEKATEYLGSPDLINIPANHIAALLYAGIARKAAHGQKAVPNKGTFADVHAISSLLPYCDALFVDNAMATILNEGPIDKEMERYPARIFSMNSKEKFMAYLDAIEAEATSEHLNIIRDAYDKTWLDPNLTFLQAREEMDEVERVFSEEDMA